MKHTRCENSSEVQEPDCRTSKTIQTTQPFPSKGRLADNLGLPLPLLRRTVGNCKAGSYSYVVRSVQCDHETAAFEQHGSAPNFQGGVLTLCTCKHQMRATQSPDDWTDIWLAGFTSRTIYDGKHWLFYLAKISTAHESHTDLWKSMKSRTRNAKAADGNYLGDVFSPKSPHPTDKARFAPRRYVPPPVHTHRQHRGDKGWHNDINYRHSDKYRQPPLLVADPKNTCRWDEPLIYFSTNHCRNFQKWSSLSDLIATLREAK